MPCALLLLPAGPARCYAGPPAWLSPILLLGGLLLPAGVPGPQIKGSAGLTYRATGLITGTGRTPGTRTVTVTATSASGATAVTTFVWTISPPSS